MLKAIFVCLNIALRVGCTSLAVAVCLPVTAQQLTPDQTRCLNKGEELSLDVQIGGCTALLQSDRIPARNRAAIYLFRGMAYSAKKDHDRAIADFNHAIKLYPGFSDAYNNRGVVYQEIGNHDRAIADYSEAIKLNPSNAAAYSNRGYLLETRGLREQAIADFRRALAIDPGQQRSRDALRWIEAKGNIVMRYVYLTLAVIFGLFAMSVIYRLLPHKMLPANKPLIAFFPKYVFPVSNEKARDNLKSIGFRLYNKSNPNIYVRGHYLGDFSAKWMRLSVILDGDIAYLQSPLIVIFFEVGQIWKVAKEIQGAA